MKINNHTYRTDYSRSRKDFTGQTYGLYKLEEFLRWEADAVFSNRRYQVYLATDIFGGQCELSIRGMARKGFGSHFYNEESWIKNKTLNGVFKGMLHRCYQAGSPAYRYYGAKGIRICSEWLGEKGYSNFRQWAINNGLQTGLTIDRIDSKGNYEPSNCRWIPPGENYRYTSNTKLNEEKAKYIKDSFASWTGKKMILKRILAQELGISMRTIDSVIYNTNWKHVH